MAHFAELDENNVVLRVIVINNAECLDENGDESEAVGIARCKEILGSDTTWIQTSYNNNFRKRLAGVGHTYDSARNAFLEPKPFPSWVLNETTLIWEAPVAYPGSHDDPYQWDESTTSWVKV